MQQQIGAENLFDSSPIEYLSSKLNQNKPRQQI